MRSEPSPEPQRAMTLAEWAELPEEVAGEFVDGNIVEDEEVGMVHDVVVAWLVMTLGNWLFQRGGAVGTTDTRFGVTHGRGRKPDLYAYFSVPQGQAQGLVTTPPDIMVEVVSPRPKDARRDRIEKRSDYAAFGVRYYWIADPGLRSLEIFELGADGRYVSALGASEGVLTSIPGCPGLTLDLDSLWAKVTRIESGQGGESE